MQERRTDVRMLCADMVEAQWSDRAGKKRRTTALLEDISSSGACLQMEAPLSPGIEIRLSCPQREFSGTVVYCVYREIGYFVGVEFQAASRWSRKEFKPQHLLDLRTLVGRAKPQ